MLHSECFLLVSLGQVATSFAALRPAFCSALASGVRWVYGPRAFRDRTRRRAACARALDARGSESMRECMPQPTVGAPNLKGGAAESARGEHPRGASIRTGGYQLSSAAELICSDYSRPGAIESAPLDRLLLDVELLGHRAVEHLQPVGGASANARVQLALGGLHMVHEE
jgi:hypothetical protein